MINPTAKITMSGTNEIMPRGRRPINLHTHICINTHIIHVVSYRIVLRVGPNQDWKSFYFVQIWFRFIGSKRIRSYGTPNPQSRGLGLCIQNRTIISFICLYTETHTSVNIVKIRSRLADLDLILNPLPSIPIRPKQTTCTRNVTISSNPGEYII